MKNLFNILFLVGGITSQSACTSHQWYEATKNWQKNKCNNVPSSEYKECRKEAEESYGAYENKRKEIVIEK